MTDRRAFIGRNRTLGDAGARRAAAARPTARRSTASTRSPACACACRIAPGATARVTFATAADDNVEALMPSIDRYLQPMHVERATRMAATLAQVRLRDLEHRPGEEPRAAGPHHHPDLHHAARDARPRR